MTQNYFEPVELMELPYKEYEDSKLYLTYFQDDKNPNIALFLGNAETEEMYAIINVNVAYPEYKAYDLAIKSYAENEGMLEFMMESGLVEPPRMHVQPGFVKIPVCKATEKLITMINLAIANEFGPEEEVTNEC